MHALVQAVGAFVVALAAAAFAHFGVALKDAPAQQKPSAVRRIPIVAAMPAAPCLKAQTRRI